MTIPNQGLKVCKQCGESKPFSEFRSKLLKPPRYKKEILWFNTLCRDCDRVYHLKHYKKEGRQRVRIASAIIKEKVFAAYGGWICNCCGETEKAFLSIDHVNNDGNQWRKEHGGLKAGAYHYRWIMKNGFPEGLQVLCMNCNFGKRMNGGTCPHKQGVTTKLPVREVGSSEPKRRTSLGDDDIVWSDCESSSGLLN